MPTLNDLVATEADLKRAEDENRRLRGAIETARAEERERCAEIVRQFFNDAGPRELLIAQVLIDRIKPTE